MLNDEELIRYQRQLLIEGWDIEVQEKLKQSVVFIAGAGGLGSPVLLYLAAAGVGTLKICDSDRIELSNLNRQIHYPKNSIGSYKVETTSDVLKGLNPNIHIVEFPFKIDKANVASLLDNVDLIMDCLDNIETRYVLNEWSFRMRIPMIHAGVSGLGGQITFLQPPETPCLTCIFHDENVSETSSVVGCIPGTLGSLQALEAIKYLTGIGTNLKNRLLIFDGENSRFETIGIEKDPNCPICGINRKLRRIPEVRNTG